MERIDNERAPVKTKSFVVNGAKRSRLKKGWKEAIEKYMLARVLEKCDAQYCVVQRLAANLAHPCSLGKRTCLRKDEASYQHS